MLGWTLTPSPHLNRTVTTLIPVVRLAEKKCIDFLSKVKSEQGLYPPLSEHYSDCDAHQCIWTVPWQLRLVPIYIPDKFTDQFTNISRQHLLVYSILTYSLSCDPTYYDGTLLWPVNNHLIHIVLFCWKCIWSNPNGILCRHEISPRKSMIFQCRVPDSKIDTHELFTHLIRP
jgi:hypothetical protein